MRLPPEIQTLMLEMEIANREHIRKIILADPVKHKTTLEFPEGARLGWRYWGTIEARGRRYRYCYSTERNLAGYFLCWREVVDLKRDEGRRDQLVASKTRGIVREKARHRYEAHMAKLGRKK